MLNIAARGGGGARGAFAAAAAYLAAQAAVTGGMAWLGRAFGYSRHPLVGVVRLTGVISPTPGPFRPGVIRMAGISKILEGAFALPNLRAVALLVNSPGGSPVQSFLIQDRIRQLAESKKIPVMTFCEDVAASGGYLLAISGDEVYAHPTSIVGSIGVVSAGFGFHKLLERLGIERRVHAAGPRKVMLDPFSPEKPEDAQYLEDLQREVHGVFIDRVKERRGDKLDKSKEDEIFSGQFWTGQQALKLGLVDGLGDVHSIVQKKFDGKAKLRVILDDLPLFSRFLGGDGGVRSANSIPHDALWALESRELWAKYGL
eukprot:jgi/Chlat1/2841/Chrsp194S08769